MQCVGLGGLLCRNFHTVSKPWPWFCGIFVKRLVTWYLCLLPRKVEKIQYTLLSKKKNIDKGSTIFHEEVGAGGISRTPITNYHAPPRPLSPYFSCPPTPHRRSFIFGWPPPPPFKRYIIIIKPHMNIFCSVQYDLYFLFNVKLLTTHSTDVAATSVNSKNKFCPF